MGFHFFDGPVNGPRPGIRGVRWWPEYLGVVDVRGAGGAGAHRDAGRGQVRRGACKLIEARRTVEVGIDELAADRRLTAT